MSNTTQAVTELNDSTFRDALASHDLAIVDLYASWCGSCRIFAPSYAEIAAKNPQIPFYKIDGDAHPESRSDLTIDNLPYIAAYRQGKFIDGLSTTSVEMLEGFLKKVSA